MALKIKVHNTLYVGIGDMYRMVIKIANEDDIQLYVRLHLAKQTQLRNDF